MIVDEYKHRAAIHSLHEFARKQKSQQNSSVVVTVWRAVIEKGVTEVPKNSSAFGHCVSCCYCKECFGNGS